MPSSSHVTQAIHILITCKDEIARLMCNSLI